MKNNDLRFLAVVMFFSSIFLCFYMVLSSLQFVKAQLFDLHCYIESKTGLNKAGQDHLFATDTWKCVEAGQ